MRGTRGATKDYAGQNIQLERDLGLCATGSRIAFLRIHDLTNLKFLAIITDLVRDEELALDILQEAYFSIWKNADRFDPVKSCAFTWMLVIMRNRAIDGLRKRARSKETCELKDGFVDGSDGPFHHTTVCQTRRILKASLSSLPDKIAHAITLNVVQGLTCREIGEQINVPSNTVKSWIRRGLTRIRDDLPFDTNEAMM